MIGIEEIPEPGQEYDAFEAGLLLPVPGNERNAILFESRDGSNIQRFTASRVILTVNDKTVFKVPDVKVDVFITDARLAFACSKYDKGGGWIGGPAALALNAGSKTMAAIRRRGKMLVGQARYPWIGRVGSTTKVGWLSEEQIYITGGFTKERSCRLMLQLPKNVSASKAAAEIARRAAAYRLAVEAEPTEKTLAGLNRLAQAEPLPPAGKNKINNHVFPNYWFINEKSARLAP